MSIRPQQMEMFIASQTAERLGANIRLMEMILERRNMFRALKQVRANKEDTNSSDTPMTSESTAKASRRPSG